MLVAQSCPTVLDPMDCSLPGSSVHGILQARTLEWVAIPFANPGIKPRSPALQAESLPSEPPGKSTIREVTEINVFKLCPYDDNGKSPSYLGESVGCVGNYSECFS